MAVSTQTTTWQRVNAIYRPIEKDWSTMALSMKLVLIFLTIIVLFLCNFAIETKSYIVYKTEQA